MMAREVTFEKGAVFPLKTQEGFKEVSDFIIDGKLDIRAFKFIILLCGCADLWELDKVFKQGLALCLNAIRNANNKALVILTATLPQPGDSNTIIKNCQLPQ